MKSETCKLCGASFVKNYKEQQYCNECLSKYPSKTRISIEEDIMRRKFKNY